MMSYDQVWNRGTRVGNYIAKTIRTRKISTYLEWGVRDQKLTERGDGNINV